MGTGLTNAVETSRYVIALTYLDLQLSEPAMSASARFPLQWSGH